MNSRKKLRNWALSTAHPTWSTRQGRCSVAYFCHESIIRFFL